VSYIREWGNFRSFYTSLGNQGSPYTEATFVWHVGGGLVWRRGAKRCSSRKRPCGGSDGVDVDADTGTAMLDCSDYFM
jgi:hypothetical protein